MKLLVSVRNAVEAKTALENGADLIDVKEPILGSLGKADSATIASVVSAVAGRRPVSAALGELIDQEDVRGVPEISYVKWGLAGCAEVADWQIRLQGKGLQLRETNPNAFPVAVAYADWRRARAPSLGEVVDFVRFHRWPVLLVDTWEKDGSHLLDWVTLETIQRLCEQSRQKNFRIALAGSLKWPQIEMLLPLTPDWFAVRGAVCTAGRRSNAIVGSAVRQLAQRITTVGLGFSPRWPSRVN